MTSESIGELPVKRGGPIRRFAEGVISTLDWSGRIISVICLVGLFLALLANIILRAINGSGITWAYEIHTVLLPWMIGGGVVMAAAFSRHIAITLLPGLLSRSGRRALALAIQAIIAVICISTLWTSQPVLQASTYQRLSTLGLTQIWGYSSMVYAFSGIAVVSIMNVIVLLTGGDLRAEDDAALQSLS